MVNIAQSIGIVGTGPSGQGVLEGILQEKKAGNFKLLNKIIIFEPSDEPFAGYPYSSNSKLEHHLTSSADTFKTYENNFGEWVNNNKKYIIESVKREYQLRTSIKTLNHEIKEIVENGNDGNYYPPRYIVGLYLKAQSEKVIEELKELGIEVILIKKEVIKIENSDSGFNIITKDNNAYRLDKVANATGLVPYSYDKPDDIDVHIYSPNSTEIIKEAFYNKINKNEEFIINIIGANASGVDASSTIHEVYDILQQENPDFNLKINVALISRNGGLPHINIDKLKYEDENFQMKDYENQHLVQEELMKEVEKRQDVITAYAFLLQKEIDAICIKEKFCNIKFDLISFLKERREGNNNLMREAEIEHSKLLPYRIIMTALLNSMPCIYRVLEKYEQTSGQLKNCTKGMSLKEIHDEIIALTSATPQPEAKRILYSNNNICFKAVRVREIEDSGKKADVTIDARTVKRKGNTELFENLNKNNMISSQGHSLHVGFLQLAFLAAARYNTVAHNTGKEGVRYCLTDNAKEKRWRFYDNKDRKNLNLKTSSDKDVNVRR